MKLITSPLQEVLIILYNESALIKVTPKQYSYSVIAPSPQTFAMPLFLAKQNIFGHKSIMIFIVEVAYRLLYKLHCQSFGSIL